MFVIKSFNKAADTTCKGVIDTVVGYFISNTNICIQDVSLKVSLRNQENRKILLAAIVVKVEITKFVKYLAVIQSEHEVNIPGGSKESRKLKSDHKTMHCRE